MRIFFLLIAALLSLGANFSYADEWLFYKGYDGQPQLIGGGLEATDDGRLFVTPFLKLFVLENGQWDSISNPALTEDYKRIFSMKYSVTDDLWLGTLGGLAKYSKERVLDKVSKLDYGSTWDYGHTIRVATDNKGKTWFRGETVYLSYFDGEKFKDYNLMDYVNPLYGESFMVFDGDSLIWLPTHSHFLVFNVNSGEKLQYKLYSYEDAKLGTGIFVKAFGIDPNDNVFASTNKGAFSVRFNGVWTSVAIPDTLGYHDEKWLDKYIKKIVPVSPGVVYIFWATHDFFCKYDHNTGVWTKISFPQDIFYKIEGPVQVAAIEMDRDGYLWISTANHGLLRYKEDPKGATDNEYALDKGLPGVWIEKLYPNPVRDNKLTAKIFCLPDGVNNAIAYICDNLGSKLIDLTDAIDVDPRTGQALLECPIENLAEGSYLFVLQKGADIRVKNFVKIGR